MQRASAVMTISGLFLNSQPFRRYEHARGHLTRNVECPKTAKEWYGERGERCALQELL